MLKQIYSQGYGEVSILKSKRTFVVGGLTGTAVWDPRLVRGEEEKGRGEGGFFENATVHDAPCPGLLRAKAGSFFDILHTHLCYCCYS